MSFNVKIDRAKCKGCRLCVVFCSRNSLKPSEDLNKRGVHPIVFIDNGCVGCKSCALICPETCIEIEKM